MHLSIYKKNIATFLLSVLFFSTFLFALPVTHTLTPQRAHAEFTGFDSVNLKLNSVKTSISAAADSITSGALSSLQLKENVLDGIAFNLAQRALREITRSTIRWINSGFRGSPAFITDLNGFLTGLADDLIGEFIAGTELGALCSPFGLDVRIALDYQVSDFRGYHNRFQCSLTDIIGNVQGFFNGNLTSNGGWGSWFEMTARPRNNPYGAMVLAQEELGLRVEAGLREQRTLLDWGRGFLSMTLCEDAEGGGENNTLCDIVTPGAVIEDALTFQLESGPRALLQADEINEVVSALFGQLAQQAFTGASGLLGLSQSGYRNSSGSYLDDLVDDDEFFGFTSGGISPMESALEIEEDVLAIREEMFDRIEDVQQQLDDEDDCDLTFPTGLQNTLDESREAIEDQDFVIARLISLDEQFDATNDPILLDEIQREFLLLEELGLLHSAVDIVELEFELEEVETDVAAFERRMDSRCDSSNSNNGNNGGNI